MHSPQFTRQMQRLYDRYDLLCDACRNIDGATDALRECRDADHAESLAALEDIGGVLTRDRDAIHAELERMEAMELDALAREARG